MSDQKNLKKEKSFGQKIIDWFWEDSVTKRRFQQQPQIDVLKEFDQDHRKKLEPDFFEGTWYF